jgi:hypothetical protein
LFFSRLVLYIQLKYIRKLDYVKKRRFLKKKSKFIKHFDVTIKRFNQSGVPEQDKKNLKNNF